MAEWIIAGTMLAGTVISARSQYQQGKEERALYNQRAAVAEQEARAVTKATEHEARERGKKGRRDIARAKVLFAKSGVKPKLGTPRKVSEEIKEEYLRDMGFIQEGGATEAARLRSEAGLERGMGKSAYRAGRTGAFATAMTGLGTTGMFAYQSGMFKRRTSPSGTGSRTMAWSGYKKPRRRTTFRGL